MEARATNQATAYEQIPASARWLKKGLASLAIGTVIFAGGGYWAVQESAWSSHLQAVGVKTTATVTEIHSEWRHSAQHVCVHYVAESEIEAPCVPVARLTKIAVGQQLSVAYDPQHPSDALVIGNVGNTSDGYATAPLLLGLAAFVFGVVAVIKAGIYRRRRRAANPPPDPEGEREPSEPESVRWSLPPPPDLPSDVAEEEPGEPEFTRWPSPPKQNPGRRVRTSSVLKTLWGTAMVSAVALLGVLIFGLMAAKRIEQSGRMRVEGTIVSPFTDCDSDGHCSVMVAFTVGDINENQRVTVQRDAVGGGSPPRVGLLVNRTTDQADNPADEIGAVEFWAMTVVSLLLVGFGVLVGVMWHRERRSGRMPDQHRASPLG